jgi:rhodanese-related sulfurtransferase
MAFVFALLSSGLSAEVSRMTKEELRPLIEKGDVIVVDVRTGRDWKSSEYKIQTAVREDPSRVASWAKKYPKDKTLFLY